MQSSKLNISDWKKPSCFQIPTISRLNPSNQWNRRSTPISITKATPLQKNGFMRHSDNTKIISTYSKTKGRSNLHVKRSQTSSPRWRNFSRPRYKISTTLWETWSNSAKPPMGSSHPIICTWSHQTSLNQHEVSSSGPSRTRWPIPSSYSRRYRSLRNFSTGDSNYHKEDV